MRKKMLILSFLTLNMIGIFIFVGLNGFDEYALKSRFLQIAAIIIVAICIAVSTVIFQTLCNNKILTPAIIGLDSLYMLLQSALIFSFGAANLSVYKNDINFLITLVCMVVFSLGLYKILFSSDRSIYLIMLLGLVFGTLFSTLSSFFEVLIDPDEFMVIQGRMFASFDNIAFDVLILAYIISFLSFIWIFRYMKFLDHLSSIKTMSNVSGVENVDLSNFNGIKEVNFRVGDDKECLKLVFINKANFILMGISSNEASKNAIINAANQSHEDLENIDFTSSSSNKACVILSKNENFKNLASKTYLLIGGM